jgi:hypothetical protein
MRIGLVSVAAFGLAGHSADAAGRGQLAGTLGELWETVLETPTPDNPFTGGDPCVDLGGMVAPFALIGTPTLSCTVKTGTRLFVVAASSECSNVEAPPFFGADEAERRACARAADAPFAGSTVRLDGKAVALSEVETSDLTIELPADNILGVPAQQAFSVAHGWVARLHPLTPGRHTIEIFGPSGNLVNTTTIVVNPGR